MITNIYWCEDCEKQTTSNECECEKEAVCIGWYEKKDTDSIEPNSTE